jgi:hypothetical protein
MSTSPQTLERIELDFETAHGNFVEGFVDPAVSPDAKMIAAAIVVSGSHIALATVEADEGAKRPS